MPFLRANPGERPRAAGAAAAGLCAALLLTGCWQRDAEPAPLRVDRTSPTLDDPAAPVLLNDALTVYFSDAIQPLSVTPDSVTLLDEDGLQVRGALEVGRNWVSFRPEPPLGRDLTDGSFRPGGRYRLMLAGHPRPNALRTGDGRWLESSRVFEVHVAARDQVPAGLPAILRPIGSELPFVVRRPEGMQQVAADAPRLQVHFTLPVLPTSVAADAFDVRRLAESVEALQVRGARVVTTPLDEHPGCTVELDLGALPAPVGKAPRPLREGDFLTVELRADGGLVDYAGRGALLTAPLYWSVVAGGSVPICEWPADADAYGTADGLRPGFEVTASGIRPRVRREAGSGRLGPFRPSADVTLRPGQPFDRGDGVVVVSEGPEFAFTSIDVPEDVTVTVDARAAPVRLLAVGGMRLSGSLRLLAPTAPLPAAQFGAQPVAELLAAAPVAICAAGDIEVRGDVVGDAAIASSDTMLLLATAGRLRLQGALPFQTMLVVEQRAGDERSRIAGPRGQSRPYAASFTPGVAAGADFEAVGELPWRQLPPHRDGGLVQLGERTGELTIEWQSTPADPIRGEQPDLAAGRSARWRSVGDGEVVVAGGGAFVRLRLRAQVRAGRPLPLLERARLVEN